MSGNIFVCEHLGRTERHIHIVWEIFLIHDFSSPQKCLVHKQNSKILENICAWKARDPAGAQSSIFRQFKIGTWTLYEKKNLNKIKIPCPGDLRPPLGRKSSQEVEIESQTTSKPSKIQKIRKSRKTAQNCRKLDFSLFQMHFRSADAANHLRCAPEISHPA